MLVSKAARLAALTLPVETLSHVYTQMVKQQAHDAICTHKRFVLNDVLEYFRQFYKRLRPPVFNAGILTLRVYQVYRDASVILGLPLEAPIAAPPPRKESPRQPHTGLPKLCTPSIVDGTASHKYVGLVRKPNHFL